MVRCDVCGENYPSNSSGNNAVKELLADKKISNTNYRRTRHWEMQYALLHNETPFTSMSTGEDTDISNCPEDEYRSYFCNGVMRPSADEVAAVIFNPFKWFS